GIDYRDGLKNLDDSVIPRQRRNELLLLLPHQRRRIDSNNFFVLFVKLTIFESIANGLPEDLGEIIWRNRRQILERSDAPKSPRQGQEPGLDAGAREGFDLRQMGKLRRTTSFGILQNGMEIDEILVGLRQRLRVQRCRSRVDFPTLQSDLQLGSRVAHDEARLFDIQEPGKQPSANVLYVPHRLGADAEPRSGAQLFQAVDAESFSGRKHINILAERS